MSAANGATPSATMTAISETGFGRLPILALARRVLRGWRERGHAHAELLADSDQVPGADQHPVRDDVDHALVNALLQLDHAARLERAQLAERHRARWQL